MKILPGSWVYFMTSFGSTMVACLHTKSEQEELGVDLHTCNPRVWDTETRGSRVAGKSRIHSETLSHNTKQNKGLARWLSS